MKLAVILKDFTLGSPAQQLLDRFLMGIDHLNRFPTIIASIPDPQNNLLQQRVKDFNFTVTNLPYEAVKMADAILTFDESSAWEVLNEKHPSAPLFLYGFPQEKPPSELTVRHSHGFSPKSEICVGTVLSVLEALPPINLSENAVIRESLIISSLETVAALDALSSVTGLLHPIRTLQTVTGEDVWKLVNKRLLYAALSRTDKAQGNTLLDGRTEDFSLPGLLQSMAQNPQACILNHYSNTRTTVLSLNGVVADMLVAIQVSIRPFGQRKIYSTQLFQPPSPQQVHFTRLAQKIANYFATGEPPWSSNRLWIATQLPKLLGK